MLILPKWMRKKKYGGYFSLLDQYGRPIKDYKNGLTSYGATGLCVATFQKTVFGTANWYLGLTSAGYAFDGTTLAALAAGEPVGNGYARQAIVLSNAGWAVSEVNGVVQAQSIICTFTATANWSSTWQRAFLCDAAAGGAGNVIAVGGPAAALIQTLNGLPPSFRYTHYVRG